MRIRSLTAEKKWRHRFSHYKPVGIFFRHSRADNSAVGGRMRPKFKLVRDFMYVLVTCRFQKDRIKNNREKVETPFSPIITLWELSVAKVLIGSGSLSPTPMMLQIPALRISHLTDICGGQILIGDDRQQRLKYEEKLRVFCEHLPSHS